MITFRFKQLFIFIVLISIIGCGSDDDISEPDQFIRCNVNGDVFNSEITSSAFLVNNNTAKSLLIEGAVANGITGITEILFIVITSGPSFNPINGNYNTNIDCNDIDGNFLDTTPCLVMTYGTDDQNQFGGGQEIESSLISIEVSDANYVSGGFIRRRI